MDGRYHACGQRPKRPLRKLSDPPAKISRTADANKVLTLMVRSYFSVPQLQIQSKFVGHQEALLWHADRCMTAAVGISSEIHHAHAIGHGLRNSASSASA